MRTPRKRRQHITVCYNPCMARERTITAHFTDSRRYFENSLGREYDYTAATGPYEYLLGALAGCFYLTLASYGHKPWGSVDIKVRGIKRDEIPSTLKTTILEITACGVEDRDEFRALVEKAEAECSIFATVSGVSDMEVAISFA